MTEEKIEEVLERLNLGPITKRGKNLMICCPFHGERNPSFGISIEEPHPYGCFACNETGTLLKLLIAKGGMDFDDAAKLLKIHADKKIDMPSIDFAEQPYDRTKDDPRDLIERHELYPYELEGKGLDYMLSRGIQRKVLKRCGILYAKDINRVIFPWMQDDVLMGATGRTLFKNPDKVEEVGKTIPLFGSPKGHTFYFPLGRIKPGRLAIVEGETDALKVLASGFDNVGAMCHGVLTQKQARMLLRSPATELLLFLDDDKAGRRITEDFKERFKGKKMLSTVKWEDIRKFRPEFRKGKIDPAKLTRAMIKVALTQCVEKNCDWIDF